MEYKKVGKTKKIYNEFEEVKIGAVRLIKNKLYSCSEYFHGGYGYKKATWKPLNINNLLKSEKENL